MQTFQRILMSAVVVTLGAVLGIALAQTTPRVEAASGVLTPDTCVSFPERFVNGSTALTQTVAISLSAGTYDMLITTEDGYPGRTDTPKQDGERVRILGIETDDLHDGVERHTLPTRGRVVLPEALTSLTATHLPVSGPDSVSVPSVCFARLPDPTTTLPPPPPPSTTVPVTEPPTTTTVPVTVPETTVPVTEPPPTEPPVTEPPTPPTTEPPVEVPVTTPVPDCADYPAGFVPSFDYLGARIGNLCQPAHCEGDGISVPGVLLCQYLPEREMG